MSNKLYPTDTLKQASSILIAWEQIDPSLAFGPLTSEALAADLAQVRSLQEKIVVLRTQLLDMCNQRDEACIRLWDRVKRTRAGIKGFYGDDSTEYEMAGGTRRSKRKKPRRKTPPQEAEESFFPPDRVPQTET